jgi:peptidyl-prolyl cis-trans isomerase C
MFVCHLLSVRHPVLRRVTVVLLGAGLLAGCKSGSKTKGSGSTGQGEVVARIGDQVITTGDLEAHINRQPAFARARYSTPEKKKELLDNLVRFEVMAREAKQRGYDNDPDVQRAVKQEMIRQLVTKEIETPLSPEAIAETDVARYYEKNKAEFAKPEEVRVSQIFTRDRAKAEKAAAEARAAKKSDPQEDAKAFRDLVAKHSEDEDSKQRGGDLTFFDRNSPNFPRPLVEAAFALKDLNDVSAPVESPQGFHVLKLTQRRPGFTRTLAEVRRDIQMRLHQEAKAQRLAAMEAEMRQKVKVEIFEDELAKVKIDPPAADGTMRGTPPGP